MTNRDHVPEERDSRLLHNMSAPPRLKVRIEPLRHEPPRGVQKPRVAEDYRSAGLSEAYRINVRAFAVKHLRDHGITDLNRNRLRERLYVALSRFACGLPAIEIPEGDPENEAACREQLVDEFLLNTSRLDPIRLGLPAFGFIRRAACGPTTAVPPLDQGLAFLSRMCKGLFVAAHAPTPSVLSHSLTNAGTGGDLVLLVPALNPGGAPCPTLS